MLITNFASGELSQNLNGRVDIQQYYQGASRIENFEIIPTGGIKRRPGTKRLAQLSGNNRIIPFIVDKNNVYIFELGLNPEYDPQVEGSKKSRIRIWQQQVTLEYSVIQTIYTDYGSDTEIKELQYAQNYDTLIIVHRSYRPAVLKLTNSRVFAYSEMEFDFSPDVELDDDFDYVMIVAGNDFPIKIATEDEHGQFSYRTLIDGTSQLITKDFNVGIVDFWCVKNGRLYKYNNSDNTWVVYGTDPKVDTELFTTTAKMPGCVAFFNNRLFFASTLNEHQKVWASAAPDSYGNRYNVFSNYRKYITVNKVVREADLHVFTCDLAQADIDTTNHTAVLRNVSQDFTAAGVLKHPITDYYVSGSKAEVPVGTKVMSATNTTITVYTGNITAGNNLVMSIQLWRDADEVSADDYEFAVVANNVTTADCALFFELASDQNDSIMFLSSNRFLAVGTESSIWSVDPGINALNITASMQGRYGSDEIQGQAVETATVYFAQGKKGIREFYYDGESKAFRTNNIALLADHILRESAAMDFDYMTNPYSRLLIVRADGILAEMLYDKTNGIMAWSRIIHAKGLVRNCAVTRGNDENDLVFLVVKDGNLFYLELLDFGSTVYLDSYKVYEGVTTGYSDEAILYNETKNITCPCNNIPADFIDTGDVVYIGYLYRSYIKSMPVVGRDPSRRIRITDLLVRFLNSYKPVMKVPGLADEKFNSIQNVPYSGIAKVTYPGQTDHDVCFELEAKEPACVNILSVDAQTA